MSKLDTLVLTTVSIWGYAMDASVDEVKNTGVHEEHLIASQTRGR
jgi:hypothetical protein